MRDHPTAPAPALMAGSAWRTGCLAMASRHSGFCSASRFRTGRSFTASRAPASVRAVKVTGSTSTCAMRAGTKAGEPQRASSERISFASQFVVEHPGLRAAGRPLVGHQRSLHLIRSGVGALHTLACLFCKFADVRRLALRHISQFPGKHRAGFRSNAFASG
jgi:hypothetical protein